MTPADVVELTSLLGSEFEVVLADQYFSLIREAHDIVEPSLSLLQQQLEEYIDSAEITGPLIPVLTNRLRQVDHHFDKGNMKQANKQLQKFREHLNHKAFEKNITEQAKQHLDQSTESLLERGLN